MRIFSQLVGGALVGTSVLASGCSRQDAPTQQIIRSLQTEMAQSEGPKEHFVYNAIMDLLKEKIGYGNRPNPTFTEYAQRKQAIAEIATSLDEKGQVSLVKMLVDLYQKLSSDDQFLLDVAEYPAQMQEALLDASPRAMIQVMRENTLNQLSDLALCVTGQRLSEENLMR